MELASRLEELSSVVELPRIKVGIGLELVARVLVVDVSVERHLKPVVTVAEGDTLVEVGGLRGVLGCISLVLCHIAHIVIISHTGVTADVPVCRGVEGGIEREAAVKVPVAVDILRT